MNNRRLIVSAIALGLAALASAKDVLQNEPPVITHYPPGVAYAGQPIPIYAEVADKTGKVKKVTLYYALSQQQAPVGLSMGRVSGNRYSGAIPANFFAGMSKVWYFVEARDSYDDKSETTWLPVLIKNPDTERTQSEQQTAEQSSAGQGGAAGTQGFAPPKDAKLVTDTDTGGIGGGTVLIGLLVGGGAGAAVAAGGGGGDGDGGGSFDPGSFVSRGASASGSGGSTRTIDGTAVVAGRAVKGVRVTVNYDAFSTADVFEILYEGRVLATSGSVTGAGSVTGVGSGSSSLVEIRVSDGGGGFFVGSCCGGHGGGSSGGGSSGGGSPDWKWSAQVDYGY